MRDEVPQSVQEHISMQPMGDETLLYDQRRHRAFCLNATSSAVWRLADGARTMAEIARVASLELGAPIDEELVRYAIEELHRDGLMEEGEDAVAGAETRVVEAQRAITRRVLLQRLGVGGAMLLPVVASIVAPTAAQAYSGCVDCTDAAPGRAARARRQQSSGTGTAADDPEQ